MSPFLSVDLTFFFFCNLPSHAEPELDNSKTVFENIMDGVPEKYRQLLSEFHELQNAVEEHGGEEKCSADLAKKYQEAKLLVDQQKITDVSRKIEIAIHALKCPPGHFSVENLSGVPISNATRQNLQPY